MEPTHPWDTMHKAAHAYAVERLTEEIDTHRQAAGWIRILPETTEHVTAMMEAIGTQLASVLNQVDRPTLLADDDKRRDEDRYDPVEVDEALAEKIRSAGDEVERKLYRFDATGDIERPT